MLGRDVQGVPSAGPAPASEAPDNDVDERVDDEFRVSDRGVGRQSIARKRPKRILVAEDDTVSLRLLEATVRRWGYDVTSVRDGATALAKLSEPDGPCIAILDWEMPGLSGPQVCRIIRGRTSGPYVYLIVLTGRSTKEHLVTGLSSGADDFVSKPFDPTELRLRVRTGQRIVDLQAELLEARKELERRANHDALTGAVNRGALLNKVEEEASRSSRQKTHYCLILFDLDHFKSINDTHGHRAGDTVLKEAVVRARQGVRPYDVVGRYGGEEFMVLLPDCELDEGRVVAERLRSGLCSRPVQLDDTEIDVSASFGVVCSSIAHQSLEVLVDAADRALYRAKARGRNRVELGGTSVIPGLLSLHGKGGPSLEPSPQSRLSFSRTPSLSAEGLEEDDDSAIALISPVFDRNALAQARDLLQDGAEFLEEFFAKYVDSARRLVEQIDAAQTLDERQRLLATLRGASTNIGAVGVADACKKCDASLRTADEQHFDMMLRLLRVQVDRALERYPMEIERMSTRVSQSPASVSRRS